MISFLQEIKKVVKTNKIKLAGSAKVQIPILYFDGTYYRVRTKLEFKIVFLTFNSSSNFSGV